MAATIPPLVLAQAISEVPAGAQKRVHTCVEAWHARQLSDHDLETTLRALAWQSPCLQKYFAAVDAPELPQEVSASNQDNVKDLLSESDIMELLVGCQGKVSLGEVGEPQGHGLRHSVRMNSWRQ